MARKAKKFHYIYKTICEVSSRYYIGMHSTNDLDDGYMGSGKRLWNSIKKHGKENHKMEILEFYENRTLLKNRELELVNLDLIDDPLCMNLVIGGSGFSGDEHTFNCAKKGGIASQNKIKNDPILKQKMFNALSKEMKKRHATGLFKYDNFTGKKHKEETIILMKKIKKGQGIGESNSQYNTCWITKDRINKKIKIIELPDYVNNGWKRGREI